MSDKLTVHPEWVGIDHAQLATPAGGEAPFGNRIELIQANGDGTH